MQACGNKRLETFNRQLTASASTHAKAEWKVPFPQLPMEEKYDALLAFHFDSALTPEEAKFRKQVRQSLQKVKWDATKAFETATIDRNIFDILKQIGPGGGRIKGYGCPGLSTVEVFLSVSEAARIDASLSTAYTVHNALVMSTIDLEGTPEQKSKWLPKLAKYEKIGAFGLTEPDHGSDATRMDTKASPVKGGWVLNGEKRWVAFATIADVMILWAINTETHKVNAFLVEKDTPGVRIEKIEHQITLRGVESAHVFMENVFVPNSNHTLASGFGGSTAQILEFARALISFSCTGLLLGAYERALHYCTKRKQFNKSIGSFQLVQERLMRTFSTVQGMMLCSLHLARMMDTGKATMKHIALSKAWCSKCARDGIALCREVVGANGTVYDYGVAAAFLDAEALYTYEGTYDINTLVAGRLFTGHNAFGR